MHCVKKSYALQTFKFRQRGIKKFKGERVKKFTYIMADELFIYFYAPHDSFFILRGAVIAHEVQSLESFVRINYFKYFRGLNTNFFIHFKK